MLNQHGAVTILDPLCIFITSNSIFNIICLDLRKDTSSASELISLAVKAFTCCIVILSRDVSLTL
jgi:hypothetical protein